MDVHFIESLTINDKPIGKGGFGEIYLAKADDGHAYAIKALSKDDANVDSVEQEVSAGITLRHPNLAKYRCHFHDEENFYILFDYVPGCDLIAYLEKNSLKAFSERESRAILSQLVDGLAYCHDNEIVHFDIKLDNIIYDENTNHVTLLDFGLSDFMPNGEDLFTKRVGSHHYTAPELWTEVTEEFSGTKVDIWALGVVFFALLTARFPVTKKTRADILKGKPLEISFPISLSEEAKDLVCKMLCVDPDERITLDQIMEHPFLQQ